MDTTAGKQLPWVSGSRTYQHHIQGSVPGSSFVITPSTESLPTHYTTLSALQGSFVAIQPSAEYQSLQGSVGYQPVYISGNSFEGISADGDFVVAAGEDGVASSLQVLSTGHRAVQVPSLMLGDDSGQTQETGLSLSGSTQYSLTLGSYLQSLGDTMTPTVAGGQSVSVEEMDRSLVNISETESSTEHTLHGHLLQMGLSEVCASSRIQLPSYANLVASTGDSGLRPATDAQLVVSQTPVSEQQLSIDHCKPEREVDRIVPTTCDVLQDFVETRKSERIAQRDRSPSPVEPSRYISKPYSISELWCEDCQTSYAGQCEKHLLQPISDKVILSRAWASLPLVLQIFRLSEAADAENAELGVFAKKLISKRTQFGPFVAPTTSNAPTPAAGKFLLTVEKDDGAMEYIDASKEDQCNWMMFVRPASNLAEQNLVAYQHGTDIYFTVIKDIVLRQELKVWYAAHYAERLQFDLLSTSTVEPVEDDSQLQWPCYECSKRFRTSADLQKHLAVHDADVGLPDTSDTDSRNDPECVMLGISRRGYRRKRPSAVAGDDAPLPAANTGETVSVKNGTSEGGEFQS